MNIITSPDFNDRFRRSIDATIPGEFSLVSREVPREARTGSVANALCLANRLENEAHDIYADDRLP
jgi:hypothetical protein